MAVNYELSLSICTEECFLFLLLTSLKDPACGLFLVLNVEVKRVRLINMKTILPRGPFSYGALNHDLHHQLYMLTFSIFSEYLELILTTVAEVQS